MSRPTPLLPAHAMQTYKITSPLVTHWRDATCTEVDCQAQADGWTSWIDESTALGQRQAAYIRRESRRSFTEGRNAEGLTWFDFPPGQTCFAGGHRLPVGRPEIYIRRVGDWRGDPTRSRPYIHTRPEHWVEDFALHQQRISDAIEKG